jgi:hypothetical protein
MINSFDLPVTITLPIFTGLGRMAWRADKPCALEQGYLALQAVHQLYFCSVCNLKLMCVVRLQS